MFNTIDINSWPRAEIFYYFSKMAPTGYSVTVNVDVTNLADIVSKRNIRFFPSYLWLVTRNLNRQTEFKCAEKDGILGYYDTLSPLYASWHDDTKTFSLMWADYSEDFNEFHSRYLDNLEKYGNRHGILGLPGIPPENAYTVSEIPWLGFSHFAVHSYENKPYYFPSVEAGKYHEQNGRMIMPLSVTCHHATTDGYHVYRFFEDLQSDIDSFGDFI